MSRREKRAVRKISSSKLPAQEENNENIPISQLYTGRVGRNPRSGPTHIRPNLTIIMGNTYLFRDDKAYCNYTAFCKRPQADCYYFIKNGELQGDWENEKATGYVNKWGWKPLLECTDPYLEVLVRAFYANIVKFSKYRVPWGFTTYVCGQEIEVTLPNVAAWLGLVNDGEEIYLNKAWLKDQNAPSSDDYFAWFGAPRTTTTKDKRFYVTILHSLHRLGFAILNHILTPKGGKKTSVEYNQLFYLRHLIDDTERMFNIPYVIISHMLAAYSDSQRVLPYGNLIARMLKANGIDLSQSPDMIWPNNLWNHLESHGWDLVEIDKNTGTKVYRRKDNPVDRWIAEPNALPNQYWNPNLGQSQHQTNTSGSSSQPAYSDEFQKSVLEALASLSTSNAKLDAKCDQIIQTQAKHTEEIELLKANYNGFNDWARGDYRNLYKDYQALKSRFIVRFGPDDDDDDDDAPTTSRDEGGDGDDDPMEP